MPTDLRHTVREILRRATGERVYDWSTFSDRPVGALDTTSFTGERNEGGWRGYAGSAMERRWSDIFTIDVFLSSQRPSTIIELGTGTGAFSAYLATYAYVNGAAFHTFDSHLKAAPSKRSNQRALRLVRAIGGKTHRRDIFEASSQAFIKGLIARGGSVFLYCDNGDKPREVQLFAPALKTGDTLGVHDYGSEIHERDFSGLLGTHLTPWEPQLFERLSSSNRIFVRASAAPT